MIKSKIIGEQNKQNRKFKNSMVNFLIIIVQCRQNRKNSKIGKAGYMIQRYSIILWKKVEEEDKEFKQISQEAYEVMTLFQDYPVL